MQLQKKKKKKAESSTEDQVKQAASFFFFFFWEQQFTQKTLWAIVFILLVMCFVHQLWWTLLRENKKVRVEEVLNENCFKMLQEKQSWLWLFFETLQFSIFVVQGLVDLSKSGLFLLFLIKESHIFLFHVCVTSFEIKIWIEGEFWATFSVPKHPVGLYP